MPALPARPNDLAGRFRPGNWTSSATAPAPRTRRADQICQYFSSFAGMLLYALRGRDVRQSELVRAYCGNDRPRHGALRDVDRRQGVDGQSPPAPDSSPRNGPNVLHRSSARSKDRSDIAPVGGRRGRRQGFLCQAQETLIENESAQQSRMAEQAPGEQGSHPCRDGCGERAAAPEALA